MTWRQLFARRPRWWVALAARLQRMTDSGSEPTSADTPHRRSSEERAHFWEEFRAGQREADRRVLEDRKILTPCRENGTPK
jgi:hypothetical protein